MSLLETTSNPPLRGRFTRVWGRRVHYHRHGDGPPVLLLHGNGSIGEEILSPFHGHPGMSWIAPDRPGYGLSEPIAAGAEQPEMMARWVMRLLDVLDIGKINLVAHSIAAGPALWLLALAPERINHVVLLAPFCRPTPHRWMLGLRLAVAPVAGRPVRRLLLPAILPLFRRSILEGMMAPNPVPPWLKRFPVEFAARGPSLRTMAGELRRFNEGMTRLPRRLRSQVPVTAIVGSADETAPAAWHVPWLRSRVPGLALIELPETGHAVHHAHPGAALRAIAKLQPPTSAPSAHSGSPRRQLLPEATRLPPP